MTLENINILVQLFAAAMVIYSMQTRYKDCEILERSVCGVIFFLFFLATAICSPDVGNLVFSLTTCIWFLFYKFYSIKLKNITI